jgi:hypothetical protein
MAMPSVGPIIPAVLISKEKITLRDVIGAMVGSVLVLQAGAVGILE